MDGLQRSKSNFLKQVTRKDQTQIFETFVAACSDSIRKSEDEAGARQDLADHFTEGKSWCKINDLIRGEDE